MTFSICAYDPQTGQLGVAALTAQLGVGKLVAHARPGAGASASQALINPYLAFDSLDLLAEGRPAEEVLDEVISRDEGREYRQLGLIDRNGQTAAWTGSKTPDWSGHIARGTAIAQGNRLVGRETLEATLDAFYAHPEKELAHRLLHAIEAGESTGADKDGALSGAVTVVGTERYPLWDVRVDRADDPAAELRSLVEDFDEQLVPQIRKMSTREDYVGQLTREFMAEEESGEE